MKEGTPPPLPKPSFFHAFQTGMHTDERRYPSPLFNYILLQWFPFRMWRAMVYGVFKNDNWYISLIFSKTIIHRKKFLKQKLCISMWSTIFIWKIFFVFCIVAEVTRKNHDFYVFLMISPWKLNLLQFLLSYS